MANILIIEDVKEIGDNLSEFARLAGHSSRYAQRFADLTVSHLHEATHIILDLNMPEHDGIDILEALSEEHIEAPIILCSGMTEDIISSAIDVVNELGLSFGGALPKPFTYDQFRHTVSSAKKNNSSGANQRKERDAISLTRGDLRIAIQREWFYPVYQPQYDIINNRIMGIECLARLNHP
ncbi:response regulator, partial [Alteromonas sp.]|nr:response regulator [Alteromonas sp.]